MVWDALYISEELYCKDEIIDIIDVKFQPYSNHYLHDLIHQ